MKKYSHLFITVPEMEKLAEAEVDVALLPSGNTYTMDLEEAAEAALVIKPKIAIPMHLKGADPAVFKEKVESQSDIKVVILGEGEEYTLEQRGKGEQVAQLPVFQSCDSSTSFEAHEPL